MWQPPISNRLCLNSYSRRLKRLVFPQKPTDGWSAQPHTHLRRFRGHLGLTWPWGCRYLTRSVCTHAVGHDSQEDTCWRSRWPPPHSCCSTLEFLSPWRLQNSFLPIEGKASQGPQKKSQIHDVPKGPCRLLAFHEAAGRLWGRILQCTAFLQLCTKPYHIPSCFVHAVPFGDLCPTSPWLLVSQRGFWTPVSEEASLLVLSALCGVCYF